MEELWVFSQFVLLGLPVDTPTKEYKYQTDTDFLHGMRCSVGAENYITPSLMYLDGAFVNAVMELPESGCNYVASEISVHVSPYKRIKPSATK